MKVLLIAVIITSGSYQRGFGDGIAGAKSASSAIHMERFSTFEECNRAREAFKALASLPKTTLGVDSNKASSRCVDLSKQETK